MLRAVRLALPVAALTLASIAVPADVPTIQRWGPTGASSPDWESHPAIDPRTGDLWFVRSDKSFSGWHLLVARCNAGRWAVPVAPSLAEPGLEADPWFSPDGGTIWFISTRRTHSDRSADLDIYRTRRGRDGAWMEPERLPAPINSDASEWFPRPATDGWLYFGSRRSGGFGKDDIWRARVREREWTVENLGAGINSAGSEYELEPSPDGRWGILSTDNGLYRVVRTAVGWRRQSKYGPSVNKNGTEIGPMILPDGKTFVFSRDVGGNESGELLVAYARGRSSSVAHCGLAR